MFLKVGYDFSSKEIDFKDERLPDKVNEFFKNEINDLIFGYTFCLYNCESPLEQLFYLVLDKHVRLYHNISKFKNLGLEIFEIENQIVISKYRVDFLITVTDIKDNKAVKEFVIEIDGHDFHEKTKEQAKRDKEKDRFLTSKGYTVIRFTGSEIYNNCSEKIKELLELMFNVCSKKVGE